jgi:Flp pilus assembly protein protease CpaA
MWELERSVKGVGNINMIIVWLGILSVYDYKFKKVPLWILLLYGLWVIINQMFKGEFFSKNMLFVIGLGFIFIGISFASKEKIGYGDGITILITGISSDIQQMVAIIWFSFFFLFLFAIAKICNNKYQKWRRKSLDSKQLILGESQTIAYIPFLAIAYLLNEICWSLF